MPPPTPDTLLAAPPVRDPDDVPGTPSLRCPVRLRASLTAAGASLALHLLAVLALAWWIGDQPPIELPESNVVMVTLEPRPRPEATPALEPAAIEAAADRRQPAEEAAEEQVPEPVIPGSPAIADSPVSDPPIPGRSEEALPSQADRTLEPQVGLPQLREQIMTLTLAEPDADEDAVPAFSSAPEVSVPWARAGDRIRGVPLGGGWLNPWVGPVAAYSETWGSIIGEQRGVHVLSNGQVICTRVDAPTNDEMMNPWMSMRVTYVRLCGKGSGTAPAMDDLRYAPPPPSLRRDPD